MLAEKTGVAFQLTNILRDVSEDAERGRIYLPLRDLEANRVSVEHLVLAAENREKPETVINLLALEASRAQEFYASAEELLPLIDRDSRAALWVLVTIYRGLLERIIARNYDVFSERVSVPTTKKLMILAQGMGMAVRYRMVLVSGREQSDVIVVGAGRGRPRCCCCSGWGREERDCARAQAICGRQSLLLRTSCSA